MRGNILFSMLIFAVSVIAIAQETEPDTLLVTPLATRPSTTPTSVPAGRPVIDVKSTGAAADGVSNDTVAIQKAIDTCSAWGGGVVSLPAGAYRSGSLFLKSHVTLQIEKDALLKGSTDEIDYPLIDTRIAGLEMKHPAALVNAIDCEDVAVVGAGTIDGSGKKWWDLFWKARQERGRGVDFQVLRPRLVCFTRCNDVRVTGLWLENPAFWTLHILYSTNVEIDGLTIRAPAKAASSDGIDIDSSSEVVISRCDISCDDDDICVKAGRDADGLRVNRPSEHIVISDCTIGSGGGISMGSETAGSIRDVIVRRCNFTDTGGAARIKSMPGRGGVVENITFEDITATNVRSPIDINLTWGGDDWKKFVEPRFATPVPEALGTPRVRNITFRNFSATGGPAAGRIVGLPNSPIANVTFENVWITSDQGMTLSHAPDVKLDGIEINVKRGPASTQKEAATKPATSEAHVRQ